MRELLSLRDKEINYTFLYFTCLNYISYIFSIAQSKAHQMRKYSSVIHVIHKVLPWLSPSQNCGV